MSYDVDFTQIFGTYAQKFIAEQHQIEQDIKNKNITAKNEANKDKMWKKLQKLVKI